MTDAPQNIDKNTTASAFDDADLETTLKRHVGVARLWLFWEIYAPVFITAALIVGLFLIGAFAGLWERIGDPWRGIALLTAIVFIAKAAYQAQKRRIPTSSDAKRRVETDSGQDHRPLDVLEDSPAIGAEN